jgi:signal transduction histidine kinase
MGYATKVLIAALEGPCPTAVFLRSDVMRSGFRQPHRTFFVGVAVLWCLGAGGPSVSAADRVEESAQAPVRNILLIHVVPRSTAALLAVEHTFTSTLKSVTPDRLAFHSEYVDLATFDEKEHFESELVAYLAAKYARMKLDLLVITATDSLRFTLRHRARMFPGVPIVFISVVKAFVADVALEPDVSGVWSSIDWAGTLDAARRLQPDIERAVLITGSSPVDRLVWAAEAQSQLADLERPIPITYLEHLSIEAVVDRVAALPARSVVLLGAFLRDSIGRRFSAPEVTALVSEASPVPVYLLSETQFGHGGVGGHLINYELQGRRGAEIAARVLRGERPPPIEGRDTLSYRFDARELRRWDLDARRLPPGSRIEFDRPSLWQTYGGYAMAAVLLLGLQTWMIARLLANRAHRRRVQAELAARLRFETLMSDLLAGQSTTPAAGADAEITRGLALIAEDLDVDRIIIGERDESGQSVRVTHAWTRHDILEIPGSITTSRFPWITTRAARGHIVVVSPLHPLPPEAATDRQEMLTYGTRSLLVVPLVVKRAVVGVLTCATVRREQEWPDALIERLKLLADVFANTLARHRAEAAARESEARYEQQRQALTHALRVNTLGELGASLAHELNQPLAAILANARALGVLVGRNSGGEASEAVDDIAASAKRAGDIIRRLRALSRKEYVRERGLQLDALVDEVVGLLHQDFVRRGISVRRVADPNLPTVTGDRIQPQQIILNVLVNASEALEGAEPGRRDITITTTQPAPRLVAIAIRDSGVGGKGLDTERMFERFVTSKPGGLGMGLAISRSIAEAHGGRIYAKPNVDRGLTVYVELPAEASVAV